jgi:hypothetical protein
MRRQQRGHRDQQLVTPEQNGASTSNSPSGARRALLRTIAEEPIQKMATLSNLCPIDRYYTIADKLLEVFTTSFEESDLDEAYVYGMRYANFCFKVLPTHDYYKSTTSSKLRELRSQSQRSGHYVLDALEDIVKSMDEEEVRRQREQRAKVRQLPLDERLKMLQRNKADSSSSSSISTQQRKEQIFFDQEKMRSRFAGLEVTKSNRQTTSIPPPPKSCPLTAPTLPVVNSLIEVPAIPPPPPGAPPHLVAELTSETNLFRYLYVTIQMDHDSINECECDVKRDGGGDYLSQTAAALKQTESPSFGANSDEVDHTCTGSIDPVAPAYSVQETICNMSLIVSKSAGAGKSRITNKGKGTGLIISSHAPEDISNEMTTERLMHIYASMYRQWIHSPAKSSTHQCQINVQYLKTYQGRNSKSTNGCTVISPMCVVAHLYEKNLKYNHGNIRNEEIESVIDILCPPILTKIRTKLGLGTHALIIPSDVHDYLLDDKVGLLKQSDFCGACGGNIFDYLHLSELLRLLCSGHESQNNNNRNSEINKSRSSSQQWTPSMTEKVGAALFFHEHVVCIVKCITPSSTAGGAPEVTFDLIDSMPRQRQDGDSGATRTTCCSIQALEVVLRWYASSKLTPADRNFIDSNVWDDALCDFDPRVFQAFAWATKQLSC